VDALNVSLPILVATLRAVLEVDAFVDKEEADSKLARQKETDTSL
jgi:hypothetical protein